MINFPIVLNNPAHARAYLVGLEQPGRIEWDDGAWSLALGDKEAVTAASACFLLFHDDGPMALQ